MARCPRCSSRKAKRSCPALGVEICAVCCAEGRLVTIACPVDCHYLQAEHYQQARRMERAHSRGRRFVESVRRDFPLDAERDLAFKVFADIHYFAAHEGPVEDRAIAEALRALAAPGAGEPAGPASPLALYLRERLGDAKRYPPGAGAGPAGRVRVLLAIAEWARSVAGDGTRSLEEEMARFFGSLDFETDLDYSPRDGKDPSAPLYEGGASGPAPGA